MTYKDKDKQRQCWREHYHRNADSLKKKSAERREALRAEVRKIKEDNPCVDCGGFFHFSAMDFDHIDDNKVMAVSQLQNYGRKKMMEEISKCELVCANCHRVRTWKRLSRVV